MKRNQPSTTEAGHWLRATGITAAMALGLSLASGTAMAHPPTTTGVEAPFTTEKNPTCGEIPGFTGIYAFEYKIDPADPGSYTAPDGLQVTITHAPDLVGNWLLGWTMDNTGFVVNGVIVKGGSSVGGNSYLYENQPPIVGQDSGLHANKNRSGKYAEVSHVTFCYSEFETEFQGCTLGYWKNHTESWQGYQSGQLLSTAGFVGAPRPSDTLLQALRYKGGPQLTDKVNLLLKQAVAAILSAEHDDVNYAQTVAEILAEVNAAIASQDQVTILTLQQELNTLNNAGCPLD
jgi:hypothetical protein